MALSHFSELLDLEWQKFVVVMKETGVYRDDESWLRQMHIAFDMGGVAGARIAVERIGGRNVTDQEP